MTLDQAAQKLGLAGIENPRGEARLLLAHALGVTRDETLSGQNTLCAEQLSVFEMAVSRRAGREPFAYIAGRREFWSMEFCVGPGVLIPRVDSETLIEAARDVMPDRNAPVAIADLGAGSGALLLAALEVFPNARGTGFESSCEAFAYCGRNALGRDRAHMVLADWSEAPTGAFDLVLCNPPYIPTADIESLEPEVRLYEPRAALDGGPDGLDAYRTLADLLPRLLKGGGRAVLEIGIGQAPAMELVFAGMRILRIVPDLGGIPRAVVLERPDGHAK